MVTWGNLSANYSTLAAYVADDGYPISDIWDSRILQRFFLDTVLHIEDFFFLVSIIFIALLFFVVILGAAYNLLSPLFRRLGQW